MNEIKLPFLVKLTFVLISILAIGYLAKIGQTILAPLFFSFLMALLFAPFSNFFERRLKFPRSLSTVTSLIVLMAIMLGLVYFFVTQSTQFVNDFPVLQKQFTKVIIDLQEWIKKTFDVNFKTQMDYLNQGVEKLLASTGIILGFTLGMFSTVGGFLTFSFLFFIFILNYRGQLYHFFVSVFHEKHSHKVQAVALQTQKIIKQYIVGLFIQIILVSIMTSVFLSIIGVKYAILLGVLTGLINIIPYIGIIIAGLLAGLLSFATGGNQMIIVLIGYIIIHIIDANIILPLVVGSKVKINALFTFIGLLIGESLWGISGMFLSIPFLAILKIIFENVDNLNPWGRVLGENKNLQRKRKKYKITKKIILEEKE